MRSIRREVQRNQRLANSRALRDLIARGETVKQAATMCCMSRTHAYRCLKELEAYEAGRDPLCD